MSQVKILVIDDDEGMTEILSLLLNPASSDIITANSGKDGIELVKKSSPDVVILDLMMPGMNGWQVTKAIRAFSDLPILILSAIDSPGLVAEALDAGADDYLTKPVSSGTLIARINKILRRSRVTHPLLAASQL
jgi:DNA-binding response OmpR family regulator